MQRSEIREGVSPDSGLWPASGLRAPSAPPLWTRGELALFHPYYHDDWADEFALISNDAGVWGFGDLLPANGLEGHAWKTR
ncbi:MAG: hypothetical protein IPG66_18140 [Hydrogenophilales bacterium]|nr:hypothetical protein [Hydrogenophilales bacterium]